MFLLNRIDATRFVAIEPEPRNFSLLKSNLELNLLSSKVELHNCALGSEKEQLRLYLSDDNSGDHQLYSGNEDRQSIDVSVE